MILVFDFAVAVISKQDGGRQRQLYHQRQQVGEYKNERLVVITRAAKPPISHDHQANGAVHGSGWMHG